MLPPVAFASRGLGIEVQNRQRSLEYALFLWAIALAGCRRVNELEQRCLAGDTGACEAACDKGVFGEGGCFRAGNAHRQAGALDFSSADFKRARSYFKKSCDGGYGEGCLFAAQSIDAPYGPLDASSASDAPPKMISDEELAERQRLLERACKLDPVAACKRLGDVTIGKNAMQAETAYHRACESSREREACKAQRSKEVQTLEQWRSTCTRGGADACTHLGDALYTIDAPRAVRLFVNECKLRGVEALAGGLGRFVVERAHNPERSSASSPPARDGLGDKPSITLTSAGANGSVAVVVVERAIQMHRGELAACLSGVSKGDGGKVRARLIVDLTGDVWRASPLESTLGLRDTECLVSVLGGLSFDGPLPAPATVDVAFAVGSDAAAKRR